MEEKRNNDENSEDENSEGENSEDDNPFDSRITDYFTLSKKIFETKIEIDNIEKKLFMNLKIYDYCGDKYKNMEYCIKNKEIYIYIYDISDNKNINEIKKFACFINVINKNIEYSEYSIFVMGIITDLNEIRKDKIEDIKKLCNDLNLIFGGEYDMKNITYEESMNVLKSFILKKLSV